MSHCGRGVTTVNFSSVANLNKQKAKNFCMLSSSDLNILSIGVYLKPAD